MRRCFHILLMLALTTPLLLVRAAPAQAAPAHLQSSSCTIVATYFDLAQYVELTPGQYQITAQFATTFPAQLPGPSQVLFTLNFDTLHLEALASGQPLTGSYSWTASTIVQFANLRLNTFDPNTYATMPVTVSFCPLTSGTPTSTPTPQTGNCVDYHQGYGGFSDTSVYLREPGAGDLSGYTVRWHGDPGMYWIAVGTGYSHGDGDSFVLSTPNDYAAGGGTGQGYYFDDNQSGGTFYITVCSVPPTPTPTPTCHPRPPSCIIVNTHFDLADPADLPAGQYDVIVQFATTFPAQLPGLSQVLFSINFGTLHLDAFATGQSLTGSYHFQVTTVEQHSNLRAQTFDPDTYATMPVTVAFCPLTPSTPTPSTR